MRLEPTSSLFWEEYTVTQYPEVYFSIFSLSFKCDSLDVLEQGNDLGEWDLRCHGFYTHAPKGWQVSLVIFSEDAEHITDSFLVVRREQREVSGRLAHMMRRRECEGKPIRLLFPGISPEKLVDKKMEMIRISVANIPWVAPEDIPRIEVD